jgi:hypothetical protein
LYYKNYSQNSLVYLRSRCSSIISLLKLYRQFLIDKFVSRSERVNKFSLPDLSSIEFQFEKLWTV